MDYTYNVIGYLPHYAVLTLWDMFFGDRPLFTGGSIMFHVQMLSGIWMVTTNSFIGVL